MDRDLVRKPLPFLSFVVQCSINDEAGMVVYRSKMTHGKNKKNFSIFTAEEFIAVITRHIPEKSFQHPGPCRCTALR